MLQNTSAVMTGLGASTPVAVAKPLTTPVDGVVAEATAAVKQ
jgi:hypothetical protein